MRRAVLGTLIVGGLVVASFLASFVASLVVRDGGPEALHPSVTGPRSVILIIGDGMGPQQIGFYLDWCRASGVPSTALEDIALRGESGWSLSPATDSPLTDSAAAATALACGVPTANTRIAQDPQGKRLVTCLEDARETGRRTGLVTTTAITHATPACFASHVAHRGNTAEIARQYIEESGVDVILGGGGLLLSAEHRTRIKAQGIHHVEDATRLDGLPAEGRVIGTFAPNHLPYAIDRDDAKTLTAPSLTRLAEFALGRLSRNDAPFFLMIEGGRIDHAGHLNDVAALLGEMREFDAMLAGVLAFQKEHPDTLVIVTADHETGGLVLSDTEGPLTDDHLRAIGKVANSLEVDPETGVPLLVTTAGNAAAARERSATFQAYFSTYGHTTTPVPVFALGPGQSSFRGIRPNTDIGRALREWMQQEPDR